jgi:prephenate dehydratase
MPEVTLTLGALGSEQTFNGIAANAMRAQYPFLGQIVYFPTSPEAFAAAVRGDVSATCAPERSSVTGFHSGMLAAITRDEPLLYVIAEVDRVYHCSLLAKPGAVLSKIKKVCGHDGSIAHSRRWLERNLPAAEIEVVGTNSTMAARAARDGDGSIASVGSVGAALEFGLEELVRDIDEGSRVNYWAISRTPLFDPKPTRLVVVGRFGENDQLSRFVGTFFEEGYALRTVATKVTGESFDELDYILTFSGAGRLNSVQDRLASIARARLAGAFQSPIATARA